MEQRRVLMVGLGTIAGTHLDVLRQRPDVRVVGGVDPAQPERGVPTYPTLDAALAAEPDLDLVVVATPTETHVAVVREVVDRTGALVLSEKPLATSRAEAETLTDVADRVRVAHHFAFSPEVAWALRHVRAAGWGRPTRVLSVFNDAYAGLGEARLASYVSTWVDSGPNQLSMLAPFTGPCELVSHDDERLRAVTVLAHDGGRTVLTSNWLAADSSKQTTLDYAGGRQVRMDHTSLTVTVLEDGVVTDHVGYALSAGRKEAHYRGLYDVLLSDPSDPRLGVPLATDIARLLEAATSTPPTAPRFTTLT
ncbi:MAG TPA: Gfo/Idh/MocA family oxidoreductase [Nocardioides sp.]|jgi:predicted dehydrogenase|nr:Gfo/Idh/MocA family oxidoreductase [Nocardioides sp.]